MIIKLVGTLLVMLLSPTKSFVLSTKRLYSSSPLMMRAKKSDLSNLYREIEPVLKKGRSTSPEYKPRTEAQKS